MKQLVRSSALVFALLASSGYLIMQPVMAAQHPELSEGEIRRIDKDTGKMTIRHGPLVNLDMPAMTMVFVAGDQAMLDQVKVGDKVRFQAEKVGSQYTVTKIQAAQ